MGTRLGKAPVQQLGTKQAAPLNICFSWLRTNNPYTCGFSEVTTGLGKKGLKGDLTRFMTVAASPGSRDVDIRGCSTPPPRLAFMTIEVPWEVGVGSVCPPQSPFWNFPTSEVNGGERKPDGAPRLTTARKRDQTGFFPHVSRSAR